MKEKLKSSEQDLLDAHLIRMEFPKLLSLGILSKREMKRRICCNKNDKGKTFIYEATSMFIRRRSEFQPPSRKKNNDALHISFFFQLMIDPNEEDVSFG